MNIVQLLIILILLFLIEFIYFRIAAHFNIIDRPNSRSSHTALTIRGGGIIFGIAAILFFCLYQFQYPFFIAGLFLIALISFLDDILTLNNKIRLFIHLLSVALLFAQLDLFSMAWYLVIIAAIFVIGTINAYNFMDGINGITGAYSLVAIGSLYYINQYVITFTSNELLIITGLSLIVFNFFNFRKRAKCFAGDVGSVSIAFIVLFLLLQLIIKTENLNYLLLLLIYGLDAVTTIIFRVIRKENIFEAHRAHFYQYWANERKVSHLLVSMIYALVQLAVNVLIVYWMPNSIFSLCLLLVCSATIFMVWRFAAEGSARLLDQRV